MNLFSRVRTALISKPQLFSDIVGYEKIKEAFEKFLDKEKPVNVLLTGDPSTAKTLFLQSIDNEYDDAEFLTCNTSSKAGVIDKLFNLDKGVNIVLLDELDKMKAEDQDVFLQFLESGILAQTKAGKKTRSRKFKGLKVFATANEIKKLSEPLQSRFIRLHLKAYNQAEFMHVCRNMSGQLDIDEELAEYIGQKVWDMKGYIRDFYKIANHSETKAEADNLVELMNQYGESKEEEDIQ